MGSTHDSFKFLHITCSCIFHAYVSFLSYSGCVCFALSLCLSWIDCAMAPKERKSTPARNPLQGSKSFSSFDPLVPLHVQFWDDNARKDFLKNFSKCGVHPERQIILSDFTNTPLLAVIQTRGWESLLESLMRCPVVFIEDFYSIIHSIDTFVPQFTTTFKGTRIIVTTDLISEVLHVPRVVHLDYPGYKRLRTVSKDELTSLFCETPSS